jgi:uncharacterized membrane protein SpoIIM required for sporulation
VGWLLSEGPKDLTSFFEFLKIIAGRRWPLIALLFAAEFVVVVYAANLTLSPSQLSSYETQYNSITPVLNATAAGQITGIFANNIKVAMVELFPILGLVIFGVSLYQTAKIIEVIGIINGHGTAFALTNLFALPSTWLELPAYAIAVAESIYLVYGVYLGLSRGREWFAREVRFLLVNLVLIAVVLIVAAIFEVTEIQLEMMFGPTAPPQEQAYVLLTWLPFALVLAGVIVFWRRARREAPALEERDSAAMAADHGAPQVVGDQGPPEGEKGAAGSPTSSP